MQNDYFNKLQGGSSLFMKSDHDGVTDGQSRNMPLGIKTVSQGIEHFTDWKSLSETLEKNNLANFEDNQPNKIEFSQSYVPHRNAQHADGDYVWKFPVPEKNYSSNDERAYEDFAFESRGFEDEWTANKVKILDDMAFVAYDEYTDLNRVDIDLTSYVDFRQYALVTDQTVVSNALNSTVNSIGSIVSKPVLANRMHKVSYEQYAQSTDTHSRVSYNSPGPFADFHNSILKVEFDSGEIAYFLYGGAVKNDLDENFTVSVNTGALAHMEIGLSSPSTAVNNGVSISTCASHSVNEIISREKGGKYFTDTANFIDGTVWGRFFLVQRDFNDSGPWKDFGQEYLVSNYQGFSIQLSIQANLSSFNFDQSIINADGKQELYSTQIGVKSTKLIKIQPVRKCGKVDIYTKKRSIVGSIVGNKITSNNHNLNTNDIIEISNVLFDGAQNGAADVHPLNGTKYVRTVDSDTFEVFDDKFFEKPSFTANLKTTDGITWKCISNSFGANGQSWDYHGAMFSPTGRNGYKFIDKTKDRGDFGSAEYYKDELANSNEFFTTKRIGRIDDAASSYPDSASVSLKFDAPYSELVNSNFAKEIDEKIPRLFDDPSNRFFTQLDSESKAYSDFYPYDCADKKDVVSYKDQYWGMRFGCDLDIKFSHMSGNSRVYTLVVGERGSDVSVDLLGFGKDKARLYRQDKTAPENIYNWNRENVIPWSLPHGKTHVISITVDSYNRISDISHANTLFGGGASIIDDDAYSESLLREYNPWYKFLKERSRPYYAEKPTGVLGPWIRYNEEDAYHYNDVKYYINSEGQKIYNSSYWTRSAVVHWSANDIHDYRVKNNDERSSSYLRRLYLRDEYRGFPIGNKYRALVSVDSDNVNNYSRFGSVGFGGDFFPYQRIDRHGSSINDASRAAISFYIFPFVDSFGKSVTLETNAGLRDVAGYSASNPKLVVVSASTCRSNIEYNESDYSIPLATSEILEAQDTESKIGQLQANFLYSDGSDYYNLDFMYINSDGSDCGRFFSNPTLRIDPYTPAQFGANYQRVLKTGTHAGFGMAEVMTSCSLSALRLEWRDNKLIWVDQYLYGGKSTVNILSFDDAADNCFVKHDTFNKSYIDARATSNTGDGFGIDFRYEEGLFVTNARDTETELGYLISDHFSDRDRMDYIFVYESFKNGFQETQKISASIDKTDEEKYSLALLNYDANLLDLPGAVTYDNNSVNPLTWDIDFAGRYDIIKNKILIKDPLEYSLLSRNYSVQNQKISSTNTEEYADMFLAVSEDSKCAPKRLGTSLQYNYLPQETTEYTCRQVGGPRSASVTSSVPMMFFKLPIRNLDTIEDLKIDFDIIDEDILSSFNLKGDVDLVDQPDNIIPRIVLYSQDPRSTVIENGPADRGSSNNFPRYQGGIWTEVENIVPDGQYYSYDFPGWYRGGAQDMFFYGRLPGASVKTGSVSLIDQPASYFYGGEKNLGKYFDETGGHPAWIAPDVFRHYSLTQRNNILPYAKIFLPQASQDGYNVTIPRDDLKDFIITKDHIKDNISRPSFFLPDTFISTFQDSANAHEVGDIDYSIIIGFLLTNIESFDLNTATLTHEEPTTQFNVGPIQYILTDTGDNYANARYPYSNVCNFYNSSFNGNEYSGRRVEYDLKAVVRSVSVSLTKRQNTQGRYSNKFHKIAVFAYDQDSRRDVSESYTSYVQPYSAEYKTTVNNYQEIQRTFGFNKFIPVPNTSNKNPLISISRKSAVFGFEGGNDIITTEDISFTDSKYNINVDSGDIQYDAISSYFERSSLVGSFDIDDDRFLSLNIKSNRTEKDGIRLYQQGVGASSGLAPLFVNGLTAANSGSTLWTGVKTNASGTSLFTSAPFNRPMSLFAFEVKPEIASDLFIRSVDSDNSMSLIMAPLATGVVPLTINGPLEFNNSINLVRVPAYSGITTAYVQGMGTNNYDMSLNMNAVQPVNSDMTLAFSPGFSGVSPLFLRRNLEASGIMSLTMPRVLGVHNGSMPLKISRSTIEKDTSLFVKPQRYYNEDTALYVNSQEVLSSGSDLFINSQIESASGLNVYVRSIFPSGEMDLIVKPIDRFTNSGISLHMENSNSYMPLHIPRYEKDPFITIFMSGESTPLNGSAKLFLRGQTSFNDASLFVNGLDYSNVDSTLVTEGSVGIGDERGMLLFVGKEINANDGISMVAFNNIVGDPSSKSILGSVSASVSGGLGAGFENNSPLYLEAPPSVAVSNSYSMFLKTDEPVFNAEGDIIDSGNIQFVISGNNDAGSALDKRNNASLFISNADSSTSGAILYLNRPLEFGVPLNVYSTIDTSGILSASISGQLSQNSGISMFIDTPDVQNSIDIFLDPYLE
jgi:hypothetical protein